eukprot:Hpha_TRINITY_DN18989_c0_g1::TRINITY_DN18989_c0_g1_i1::g.17645::m.17645
MAPPGFAVEGAKQRRTLLPRVLVGGVLLAICVLIATRGHRGSPVRLEPLRPQPPAAAAHQLPPSPPRQAAVHIPPTPAPTPAPAPAALYGEYAALGDVLTARAKEAKAHGDVTGAKQFSLAAHQLATIASKIREDSFQRERYQSLVEGYRALVPDFTTHAPVTPQPTPAPAIRQKSRVRSKAPGSLPFRTGDTCSRTFCSATLGRGLWSTGSRRFNWHAEDTRMCGLRWYTAREARNLLNGQRVVFIGDVVSRRTMLAFAKLLGGGTVSAVDVPGFVGGMGVTVNAANGKELGARESLLELCGLEKKEWSGEEGGAELRWKDG